MKYRFADFLLDLRCGTLEKGEAGAIHLRPQTFKLLEVLISRAPEIVSHEELLDAVWGTQHLSPSSLKQAISELRQALGDPREEPRFIETMHRRGYRFIAALEVLADAPPAVERSQEERASHDASDLPAANVPAADGNTPAGKIVAWNEEPLPRAPRAEWAIVVAFFLCCALVLGWRLLTRSPPPGAVPPSGSPRQVAALLLATAPTPTTLARVAPESSWAPTAVAELLAIELVSGGGLQVVGGDEVARLYRELRIAPDAALDAKSLERIRAYLGCDLVLRGALGIDGRKASLAVTVLDSHSGSTVFAGQFTGQVDDLSTLAHQTAARLREKLSPPLLAEAETRGPSWAGADPSQALRLYAQGLELLRLGEAVAARDLLLEASRSDAQNALIFRALARAHDELGYIQLARQAAQRAFDLSSGLPREVRLDIEGQLHLARREFAEAVEVYGALHRFFPDDLDHGLQLIAAQLKNQQMSSAEEVLAQLMALPPPRGDQPALDLQAAKVFEGSDPVRALEAARSAARKAASRGALLLVARGRQEEGWVLIRLSRFDEALTALAEAEAIFRADGDLKRVAAVLVLRASVMSSRGGHAAAKSSYEEAVRLARQIGNPGIEAQVLNNFATWSVDDDIALSRALLRRSLELKQEIGDQAGEALTRLNLANLARFENHLVEARELTSGALDLYRQLGDQFKIAFALRSLGTLLLKEGRLEEAVSCFEEALEVSRQAGDAKGEANVHYELGQLHLRRDEVPAALAEVRRSREIYERLGLVDDTVLADLQIGDILWDRGEEAAAREVYAAAAIRREQIGAERIRAMLDERLKSGAPKERLPKEP